MPPLNAVKAALNITGDYQDDTILIYMNEVVDFARDAGGKENNITVGLVARGVSDLWNYGAAEGKLSEYFKERVTQLAFKN